VVTTESVDAAITTDVETTDVVADVKVANKKSSSIIKKSEMNFYSSHFFDHF